MLAGQTFVVRVRMIAVILYPVRGHTGISLPAQRTWVPGLVSNLSSQTSEEQDEVGYQAGSSRSGVGRSNPMI